jgi:hypothetical protein
LNENPHLVKGSDWYTWLYAGLVFYGMNDILDQRQAQVISRRNFSRNRHWELPFDHQSCQKKERGYQVDIDPAVEGVIPEQDA